MAVDPFADWYPNPVLIRRHLGTSQTTGADSYADEAMVWGQVEEIVAMTRDSAGEEVTSTVTITLPITADGQVTPGSRVSLPDSPHPETVVLSVAALRFGTPLDALVVMCA